MSDKNAIINSAAKKVYNKISQKEIIAPTVDSDSFDRPIPTKATIRQPLIVDAPAVIVEKSWFGQTYVVFGYELSLLTLLIIVILLLAVIYFIGNYLGYFGSKKEEPAVIVVAEQKNTANVEPVEEEEGDDGEEVEDNEPETCNIQTKK